jgi:two-component sensor histidine kinase
VRRGAPVKVEMAPISVPSRACSQICMALHELATNAAKYGALSVPAGRVSIRWQCDDVSGLSILWTESNGPPVAAPTRTGLGFVLIKGMIEYELGGRVEVDFAESGVVCRIGIPLKEEQSPRQGRSTA